MPIQKITLEVPTDSVPEEERAELGQELLRAANGILAAFIPDRDALLGAVAKWEEK